MSDSSTLFQPIEILLVEDNPGDARLTSIALRDAKVKNTLTIIDDGEKALDFLFRRGPYAERKQPDLILLDLNLPKVDGRDVLRELKGSPELARIPVVILTSSEAEEDIARSYKLHANCYIQKPVDLEQFMKVIDCVEDFWLTVVKLPT